MYITFNIFIETKHICNKWPDNKAILAYRKSKFFQYSSIADTYSHKQITKIQFLSSYEFEIAGLLSICN